MCHVSLVGRRLTLDPQNSDGWAACHFIGKMLIFIHRVTLANSLWSHQLIAPDFSPEDFNTIQQSCSALMEEHTELRFSEVVQWDINALATDFFTWIIVDSVHPAATSRVGILSSAECQGLLRFYLNDDLCINLGLLVKISSLLYNGNGSPHPYYGRERLILMRSLVGARLLKSLEVTLKSSILTKASREKLTGLFLVLLGVVIAVSYTVTTSMEEARCELSRILAHHMVVIGERIGLLDYDVKKQQLVENCHNLWNKTGNFKWDYRNSLVVEDTDVDILTADTPFSVCDLVIEAETTSNKSHQNDPIRNTKPQTAANLRADCCWNGSYGVNQRNSPTAGGMTICFLCNGSFLSDEICPTCFGPLPEVGGYNDTNPQYNFTSTSSIPNSLLLNFACGASTKGLHRPESTGGGSQISKGHVGSRTPRKTIPPENKNEFSPESVRLQAPQRKLPAQVQRTTVEKKRHCPRAIKTLQKNLSAIKKRVATFSERPVCASCGCVISTAQLGRRSLNGLPVCLSCSSPALV